MFLAGIYSAIEFDSYVRQEKGYKEFSEKTAKNAHLSCLSVIRKGRLMFPYYHSTGSVLSFNVCVHVT